MCSSFEQQFSLKDQRICFLLDCHEVYIDEDSLMREQGHYFHSKVENSSDIVSYVSFSGCYYETVVLDFQEDTNAEREEITLIRGKDATMKSEDVLNPTETSFEDSRNSLHPFSFSFFRLQE
jgi:hypothetical protein